MPIHWRAGADGFALALRTHGLQPESVTDVEAAWQAFGEFLQVAVDGLDTDPDADVDGYIVQWGRYSCNDRLPSPTFTRQLAIAEGDVGDPDWQPEHWQMSLELCFADGSDLVGVESLNIQDSGFTFTPVGPDRLAGMADTRALIEEHEQLRAMFPKTPISSSLTFERVC